MFAEGRIAAGGTALTIPTASLAREGDKTYAWRIAGTNLKKTLLSLGPRDPRRGEYVVTNGLAAGDMILRAPAVTLKDGQKVKMTGATTAGKTDAAELIADASTKSKGN